MPNRTRDARLSEGTLFWSISAALLNAALGVLLVPVYLEQLGTEAYGLIAFILGLQGWFLLLDFGLTPTATREAARYQSGNLSDDHWRDLWHSMERIYLVLFIVLLGGIWISAPWIVTVWLQLNSLDTVEATETVRFLGVALTLQWLNSLYKGALIGGSHHLWLAGASASTALIRGALTWFSLLWIAPTLQIFAACQLFISIIECAWHRKRVCLIVPHGAARFDVSALFSTARFAGGLSLISLLALVQQQLDKLLLSTRLPLEQFGWIALTVAIVSSISLAIGPIFNLALPKLTQLVASNQGDRLAFEYHRYSQYAAWLTLPVTATLILFSKEVIGAWTGDPKLVDVVAPIVSIWVAGSAMNALLHVPYALQLAHGWLRPTLILNLIAACTHLALLFILLPLQGAMAGASAWVAVNLIYFTAGVIWMHRRLLPSQMRPWYLKDVIYPTVLAGAVSTGLWLLMSYFPPQSRLSMLAWAFACMLSCLLALSIQMPHARFLVRQCLHSFIDKS